MTKLVEKAFSEVSKLPEEEQDAMAGWLLEELASERRWEKSFSVSRRMLTAMANEALAEHRKGRTKELNANRL